MAADLKRIYTAVTLDEAEKQLFLIRRTVARPTPLLCKELGGEPGSPAGADIPAESLRLIGRTPFGVRVPVKPAEAFTPLSRIPQRTFRERGSQGEIHQKPHCFHSAVFDFFEFRLHRVFWRPFYTVECTTHSFLLFVYRDIYFSIT